MRGAYDPCGQRTGQLDLRPEWNLETFASLATRVGAPTRVPREIAVFRWVIADPLRLESSPAKAPRLERLELGPKRTRACLSDMKWMRAENAGAT